jgi:hypothetical protein
MQMFCDQFMGQGVYTLDYKLPAGASGRYKLQWYYLTGGWRLALAACLPLSAPSCHFGSGPEPRAG